MSPMPPASPGRSGFFKSKSFVVALAAVLVVGIGSAAAYVGVIVPNKPANVLKTAFINTLEQKQSSATGTVDAGSSYKVTFKTAEDAQAQALDMQLNVTAYGVTLPVEAKLVNKNIYVKVGDLTSVIALLNTYSPSLASTAQTLNGELANKWIAIDSTLIDQSPTLKCALNVGWTLNSADIKLLENQYTKNSFAAIQSSSSDTIGGKAAEKFVLNISNSSLGSFGKGLDNLSVVQALKKCPGASSATTSTSTLASKGNTPLTVWVDKGTKRIDQVSASVKGGGSVTVDLSYGPVSITAPANPESAIQVLTTLQNSLGGSGLDLSSLLSSSGSSN